MKIYDKNFINLKLVSDLEIGIMYCPYTFVSYKINGLYITSTDSNGLSGVSIIPVN